MNKNVIIFNWKKLGNTPNQFSLWIEIIELRTSDHLDLWWLFLKEMDMANRVQILDDTVYIHLFLFFLQWVNNRANWAL